MRQRTGLETKLEKFWARIPLTNKIDEFALDKNHNKIPLKNNPYKWCNAVYLLFRIFIKKYYGLYHETEGVCNYINAPKGFPLLLSHHLRGVSGILENSAKFIS
jgi:hypothetical protein